MNSMSQANIIWLFTHRLRWEDHHRDLSFAGPSPFFVSSCACVTDLHRCRFWSQSISRFPPHAVSTSIHLPGNQSVRKSLSRLEPVAALSLSSELVSSSLLLARCPRGLLPLKPKVRFLGFSGFISAWVFAQGEATRPMSNLALHFSWVSTEG